MDNIRELFVQNKYATLHSVVTNPLLASLYKYAMHRASAGTMRAEVNGQGEAPSAYSDPMMNMLLQNLTPVVERATGLALYPTFSYFRVYGPGVSLDRHTDRPSCEIAVTIDLGHQVPAPWPLWIETPAGVVAIRLDPGDGLVYRGAECPHWREPLDGDHVAQVFLFYVDQNGAYAEWKFDKRQGLASFIREPAS